MAHEAPVNRESGKTCHELRLRQARCKLDPEQVYAPNEMRTLDADIASIKLIT